MRKFGTHFVSLLITTPTACTGDPMPADDKIGSTTGEEPESESPGPNGPGCDENWLPLDGPPGNASADLPEFLAHQPSAPPRRIELSGPPPARDIDSRVPEAANSELPWLEWEEYAATFAKPTEGGYFIEGDLFRTPKQLYQAYAWYRSRAQPHSKADDIDSLLGANIDGIDEAWSGPRKIALTWCMGWIRPSTAPGWEELHYENYSALSVLLKKLPDHGSV